jgi:uncharacterized protein YbjT (DUF2867 family)
MTHIGIIGGHGKVALLLEPLLIEAGRQVTAVIRNADHAAEVSATGAIPVQADLETLTTEGIAELMTGWDAVVWSAGAGGGDPQRTWAVDRDAAIRSMDAAQLASVNRYVMVSYFGAGPDHGVSPDDSFYPYAEAKSLADAYLASSELDWTILRPSRLTSDSPTGRIETGDGVEAGAVSRGNVAAVAAAVLQSPATIGAIIEFNDGRTPIAAALG